MRKSLLGFGLGALLAAGTASAVPIQTVQSDGPATPGPNDGDFFITVDKVAGTSGLNGFDIYRFFAKFDPTSPTSTVALAKGLQSAKVTLQVLASPGADPSVPLTANQKLKFKSVDIDSDTFVDADIFGTTISTNASLTNNTTIGTMIRGGGPTDGFNFQSVSPSATLSHSNLDGDGDTGPEQDPFTDATFGNVKSYRVEGFIKNPPDGVGFDATAKTAAGNGAIFAIAIVPTGTGIRAFGQLAADKGDTVAFDTQAVPEPTALGFVGLGAMAILGRRSRK